MIYFSPAKINLGLHILRRREDGFHDLRSVMYPTALCDIIEIHQLPGETSPVRFTQSGIRFDSDPEHNLCMKAWNLLASDRELPPVAIHLHKQIPVGAGLGGGSSNASTVLRGLNLLAASPAPPEKLKEMAAQVGSDCPFFLHDMPMMMEGKGELLSPVQVSLEGKYLVLLFPDIHISTAEAYGVVSPAIPDLHLKQVIESPVHQWKNRVENDFERSAFIKHPLLESLKLGLYNAGSMYASMSGSGSSLYGIFEELPELPPEIRKYVIWKGPA
ncbi:MAG: 4-(cytidine 5'-diphospho)-2-C-methyl-D-erythritol kinase [Bacteroidota bacterium]|nr:4-(cytidine 5'-diphospho)-2-C-methyl-D-erythritol kinase [Bacteroidota bacterium]